jgi:hypothetical protein
VADDIIFLADCQFERSYECKSMIYGIWLMVSYPSMSLVGPLPGPFSLYIRVGDG